MKISTIQINAFQPSMQKEVKKLILDGLVEHWGFLDPSKNPDLDDIRASYRDATFLVALLDDQVVGCGALVPLNTETAEIMRMSVHASLRRNGLGSMILEHLLKEARSLHFSRVVLETTATWEDVISFYLRNGFQITHELDGDVYFVYNL